MKATTLIGIIGAAIVTAILVWALSRIDQQRPMTQAERDRAVLGE